MTESEQIKIARIYALAQKLQVKLAPMTPEQLWKEQREKQRNELEAIIERVQRGYIE